MSKRGKSRMRNVLERSILFCFVAIIGVMSCRPSWWGISRVGWCPRGCTTTTPSHFFALKLKLLGLSLALFGSFEFLVLDMVSAHRCLS